jgi:hypothetical protein
LLYFRVQIPVRQIGLNTVVGYQVCNGQRKTFA